MLELDSINASAAQSPPITTRPAEEATELWTGDEVLRFLRGVDPVGRHLLVAIQPDYGPVDSLNCCLATDADKIRDWVGTHNGKANLHWTVNEVGPEFRGLKPSKKDIVAIRAAHIDVDVDGANDDAALRNLFKSIGGKLPRNLTPSAMVDSGGGYQMLFNLPEKVAVATGGDAIEAQNRGLIALFDGDASTWNFDRLLRLAGTINLPDRKKRAKGRVTRLARALDTLDVAYSLPQLANIVPPVDTDAQSDKSPQIASALSQIAACGYEQSCDVDSLPAVLREKLDAALGRSEKLKRFWSGDPTGTKAEGGHSRKSTLASLLAWAGDFSAEEFAHIAWCWGWTNEGPDYCDTSLSPRDIARVYVNVAVKDMSLRRARDERDIAAQAFQPLEDDGAADVKGLCTISGPIDATAIRRREWVVYPRLPLGDASQVVGEPGVSKSSHTLLDALAIASGREHLLRGPNDVGFDRLLISGPVLIYNAEDWLDDMKRRLKVLMDFHGITNMKHEIHLLSGIEAAPLVIMERKDRGMPLVRARGADVLEAYLKRHGIKLAVLDPQISLARGGVENDTDGMNDIMQELANIAARSSCAVLTVQHTSKSSRNAPGDAGAARGAFSQVGKIRSGYTLVKVDPTDAVKWGLDPAEKLIRMDYSKNNHAAVPDIPIVLRRRSAQVGNGEGFFQSPGDTFAETSASRFAREGDSAPFLEVIGLGIPAGVAVVDIASGPTPTELKRQSVAHAVANAMGGQPECKLRDILPLVTKGIQDAGLTLSNAPHITIDMVKTSLGGAGIVVGGEGQAVRYTAEKRGAGDKAPWFVIANREGDASDTSDAKSSVFA